MQFCRYSFQALKHFLLLQNVIIIINFVKVIIIIKVFSLIHFIICQMLKYDTSLLIDRMFFPVNYHILFETFFRISPFKFYYSQ